MKPKYLTKKAQSLESGGTCLFKGSFTIPKLSLFFYPFMKKGTKTTNFTDVLVSCYLNI